MGGAGVAGNKKAELHAHLNGCIPPSLVAELLPVEERVTSTTILRPVRTMQEYFQPWSVFRTLATTADSTERIIQVAADCLAADGVVYAELRNSVRHLAALNDISLREALEWLCDGMETASSRTGVDLRLIVSLTREHFSMEAANEMLTAMASVKHGRLVGIDLTGDEKEPVPRKAASIFRKAKDGVCRTRATMNGTK
jgi:adenosine deaminase